MLNTDFSIKQCCLSYWQLSLSTKCIFFTVVSGTVVMLASTVHNVAKYYQRPKRSSNKIRILQTKFEFGKKNEFNIPRLVYT